MNTAVWSREGVAVQPRPGSPMLRLAAIEARRHVTGVTLWLGLAVTVWWATNLHADDWQGAAYGAATMATAPLAMAAFVGMAQSVGRDHRVDAPPLAEAAPMSDAARNGARLLGGVVYLPAAIVATAALRVAAGDGFWVGDAICYPGPCFGRTDTAMPSTAEWAQNVLTVAVAGAAGAAAGRSLRRKAPVCIGACVVVFLVGGSSWMWQWSPAVYGTLYQQQPFEVFIDPSVRPSDFPRHWLIKAPDEFDGTWRRVITSESVALGHDVYLAGLTMAWGSLVVRRRTGLIVLAAAVVVIVAGLVLQVASMPDGALLAVGI